eukprot:TRINITY_DN11779_c0_g1_i2.p1 TRINITY_DN11779_c0_g1~~TRINITY_DN11779_c0_g1_i2.p1  ORF type:complete len:434 (-),score=98.57 TRINITY_DN11779_c0_g1_i2:112-1413(-)
MITKCIGIPKEAVGLLIGFQGSNVKQVREQSKAKVFVDRDRLQVVISSYYKSSVDEAARLINLQLQNLHSKVASEFEHPQVTVTQLSAEFVDKCQFLSHPSSGKYQLLAVKSTQEDLKSAATTTRAKSRVELDQAIASLSISKERILFSSSEADLIYPRFRAQVELINDPKAKLSSSKMRFNIGKQLFYEAGPEDMKRFPPVGTDLDLVSLSGMRHNKELKLVFDNKVSETALIQLRSRLECLQFKKVEQKETLSCHFSDLVNRSGVQARFVLRQNPGSNKEVEVLDLSLVKSANHRLCFVSYVNNNKDTKDFRLKLLAHSQSSQADTILRDHKVRAEWNRSDRKTTLKSDSSTGQQMIRRFAINSARRKSKQIFEGKFEEQIFRVSFITIQDDKGIHCEVAGTCHDWNKDLKNKTYYINTFAFCNYLVKADA